jgi:hypothetical protein
MDLRGHVMVTRLAPEPLETSAVDVDDTALVRRVCAGLHVSAVLYVVTRLTAAREERV